jgi:hypothetical protein
MRVLSPTKSKVVALLVDMLSILHFFIHFLFSSFCTSTFSPIQKKVHPGSPNFTEVLLRIETSLLYLAKHPEFRDSALYRSKMAQLHFRALALAKIAAVDHIQSATKQAQEAAAQQAAIVTTTSGSGNSSSGNGNGRTTSPSSSSSSSSFAISLDGPSSSSNGGSGALDPSSIETGAAYGKFRGVQGKVGELTKMLFLRAAPPPSPSAIEAAVAAAAAKSSSPSSKHTRAASRLNKNKKSNSGGSLNNNNINNGDKKGGASASASGSGSGSHGAEEAARELQEEAALKALGPQAKPALASHAAGATNHAKALLEDCLQV